MTEISVTLLLSGLAGSESHSQQAVKRAAKNRCVGRRGGSSQAGASGSAQPISTGCVATRSALGQ